MTRLYFIRHGDAYDEQGLQLENYPLNNFGRIQALQLAKRLQDNTFDAMYCSRVRRAMDTCQIVNDYHHNTVVYTSALNEVGNENWPQPGIVTAHAILKDFAKTTEHVYKTYQKICKRHPNQEVVIFTHGNWIRVLLTKILADGDPKVFTHFVIHNTSLNIIDYDNLTGFEYIITVSDAAHTQLYKTQI